MSMNPNRDLGSSNIGQMMEGARELESNSFRRSAKGMVSVRKCICMLILLHPNANGDRNYGVTLR